VRYYCFLKRCARSEGDGPDGFFPHSVYASTKKDAERIVKNTFEEWNERKRWTLKDLIYVGMSESPDKLYEKAGKMAERRSSGSSDGATG
jgi:hypothetical protein